MTALIEVKNITNRFGPQLVHDGVNLSVKRGEILGLVGGSGSGKSVLLRTILGLHKPQKGQILINGKSLYTLLAKEENGLQKKWGVLFQDGALFSGFSVLENIEIPLREHTDLSAKDIENLSLAKLRMLGLGEEAAGKFPSELSGGMVRRAALARALALDPEILFLDEPTGALDPAAASSLDELILSLREILDLTVLIITHDLDTIARVCDRIAMLVDKKVETGTLAYMMKSKHPQIREFFNGPRMHAVSQNKEA